MRDLCGPGFGSEGGVFDLHRRSAFRATSGSSVVIIATAQSSVVSYSVHRRDKVRSRSKFHAFVLQLPFVHTQLRRYHRSRSCTCLRKSTPAILRCLQIVMGVHLSLLGRSVRLRPCSTIELGCASDSYSVCMCTFHFGLRLLAASVQLHPSRRQSSMLGQEIFPRRSRPHCSTKISRESMVQGWCIPSPSVETPSKFRISTVRKCRAWVHKNIQFRVLGNDQARARGQHGEAGLRWKHKDRMFVLCG